MKNRTYGTWPPILIAIAAFIFWITEGRAFIRRTLYPPISAEESSRTENQFVAVLLPRISTGGEKSCLSPKVLSDVLAGLRTSGYISIGLDDLRDFYRHRRPLPPKAILIGFGDDYPQSVALADKALQHARMRGVLFLDSVANSPALDQRRFLSSHAVRQLVKSGAWDLAALSRETPTNADGAALVDFLLDNNGHRPWPAQFARYPFRFVASEFGLNDSHDDLRALHIMTIHPEESPAEILRILTESWPRTERFTDDFSGADLVAHWVVGWGIVTSARRRLLLLPTPHQTGAGVFLRGTDDWSDLSLEFELKKFQSEFWAYARYQDDGRFVRIGSRNGYWYVEQKIGARDKPNLLARAPLSQGSLPARVRIILKGDAALIYVNDRMQFGKTLKVHPNIDRGRVLLAVYDSRPRSAMAVLASVKAQPIGSDWLALWQKSGGSLSIDANLRQLRTEAALAKAISPVWLTVRSDGTVVRREEQRDLIGSLAGFYHCRLLPIADLSGAHIGDGDRTYWGLTEAVLEPDVAGLNLRLKAEDLRNPKTLAFLKRLRDDFHMFHREVWITLDAPPNPVPGRLVDGILMPFRTLGPGLAILRTSVKP